jgi:hypothetical protein
MWCSLLYHMHYVLRKMLKIKKEQHFLTKLRRAPGHYDVVEPLK